jgi:hypothetical protein
MQTILEIMGSEKVQTPSGLEVNELSEPCRNHNPGE